jgi:hypothetical protein
MINCNALNMKKLCFLFILCLLCKSPIAQVLQGAWKRNLDTAVQTLTIIDNYFTVATFRLQEKQFVNTSGGTAMLDNGRLIGKMEFHTAERSQVTQAYSLPFSQQGNKLFFPYGGLEATWELLDDGKQALAGNWKIIGREQDGKINEMRPGARKTIKILSGSRFQWAAINSETGDFFGTGGGYYTFENGKYTENIEFFSRDASRVGASLSFNGELKDGNWHHSGLSSKGDRIYEIWSRK